MPVPGYVDVRVGVLDRAVTVAVGVDKVDGEEEVGIVQHGGGGGIGGQRAVFPEHQRAVGEVGNEGEVVGGGD